MVSLKLLLTDKMYGSIIVREIIWHILNICFNLSQICPFLSYHKALPHMLLTSSQLWVLTVSYRLQGSFYRNGVLLAILNTFNPANSIRMSLANSLTPEGIIITLWQNCISIKTIQREHTWVPATGNQSSMTACLGSLIYIGKMLWNTGMSVKTINYIKVFSQLWSLFWQICSAAAAKYQYINLISMISSLSSRIYLNTLSLQLYSLRIAAGKNSHQLHIIVLTYSSLYTTAQITITINTNSHNLFFLSQHIPPLDDIHIMV